MAGVPILGDGMMVKPNQEQDGPWNVYERIQPVDTHHKPGVGHKEPLYGNFVENV
jgi:hypothetical protein